MNPLGPSPDFYCARCDVFDIEPHDHDRETVPTLPPPADATGETKAADPEPTAADPETPCADCLGATGGVCRAHLEPDCTCYELTGGHQPGCAFNRKATQ